MRYLYFDTKIKLDKKRIKKYWSTNHEMFARAFEVYIASDLLEQELELPPTFTSFRSEGFLSKEFYRTLID
ncbi:TPA: hypothetical protein QCX92_005728 [Bacillus albus]|nr:hypothetical protein [Bacillus albus]